MKTIYIDSEFKCHITSDDTMASVETDAFDGWCDATIEGYRYIPAGAMWTRSDSKVFHGPMVTPWKPYSELDSVQREYERQLLEEYKKALSIMGVSV